MNNHPSSWTRDPGVRIEGSNGLDLSKVQAPCVVRDPEGGYRLFYTAVGPDRPYASCQGYILSAVSEDGTQFVKEPGIRLCPIPEISHMSLRVLSPTVVSLSDGRWRMYIEARGAVDHPHRRVSQAPAELAVAPGVGLDVPPQEEDREVLGADRR